MFISIHVQEHQFWIVAEHQRLIEHTIIVLKEADVGFEQGNIGKRGKVSEVKRSEAFYGVWLATAALARQTTHRTDYTTRVTMQL